MAFSHLLLVQNIAASGARIVAAGVMLAALLVGQTHAQTGPFNAPLVPPAPVVPAGFDMTGFIQEASLDTTGAICNATQPRLAGGTVKLNGQSVVIPCNTILQLPAATMTWADLFRTASGFAPTDIAPASQTGLALTDLIGPAATASIAVDTAGLLTMKTRSVSSATLQTRSNGALPSYEIRVVGNIVSGRYIAGLVFISQQSLNAAQGVISCIDYATGELQVGGVPVDPNTTTTCPDAGTGGIARVRLNDTIGRFGKKHAGTGKCGGDPNCVEQPGYDARFSPDTDNPTVIASTGFPMCIPRLNPFSAGVDPLCPQSNRPVAPACANFPAGSGIPTFAPQTSGFCQMFVMDAPDARRPAGFSCPGPGCPSDPTRQAPLQVGDTIAYNGTLKADAKGFYVSAHTIKASLGIYTQPNTKPAYVYVEEVLAGTAAFPIGGLDQETTERVKFVGFTTDPTNLVDLYALDQDPLTGRISERLLGTQSPMSNAQLGRFRTPTNVGGMFLPPTRMYRAISRTLCAEQPTGPFAPCSLEGSGKERMNTFANGLIAGQFSLPNFDFIFPENLTFGQALVPNNFQDLPFLYCGSGPLEGPDSNSPVVGQLDPAPWGAPMQDPIFRSNLCPGAKAVAAPAVFPAVTGARDVITINTATWDNRKGMGKINIVVSSSASPAPAGMFMTATISNSWISASTPGGLENPITAPLNLAVNTLAEPNLCPTAAPCWALSAPGFIIDPGIAPFRPELVPPTTITVRSSRGGSATISDAAIRQIGCQATKRFSCPNASGTTPVVPAPVVTTPVVTTPVVTAPVVTTPVVTVPVVTTPVVTAPVVTTPVVTTPVVTAPVVTEPVVTAPVVTTPVVTTPVVTAPVVTAPVVTTPVVTTPVVTTPVVTAPVVTTPVVTTPVVTTPVVTAPVVTTPVVTAPVVTTPVVTLPVVATPAVTSSSVPAPIVSASFSSGTASTSSIPSTSFGTVTFGTPSGSPTPGATPSAPQQTNQAATEVAPAPPAAPRFTPPPAPEPVIQPLPVWTPPQAQAAPYQPAPTIPAVPAVAAPVASAPSAQSMISAAIELWRAAWSKKDIATYLAAYAPDFTQAGTTRARWEAQRRERLGRPAVVAVTVVNPQITLVGDKGAVVVFTQHYEAGTVKETGRKTLTMSNTGGRWLIREEAFKPL